MKESEQLSDSQKTSSSNMGRRADDKPPGGARKHAVIVGGGLVGGVAALLLNDLGMDVTIVERRAAATAEAQGAASVTKRSINLALSRRGQQALEKVGLLEAAMAKTVPMYGRAIHGSGSSTMFQRYDEIDSSNFINSISREGLLALLLETAERRTGIKVVYGQALDVIERGSHTLHFTAQTKGDKSLTINQADLVLGCDGAYSSVRDQVLRLSSVGFSREFIDHSYKELDIRPHPLSGIYQLQPPYALHIWPRGDFMMIALPNPDRSFTCTMFAPNCVFEELEKDQESGGSKVSEFFQDHFGDLPAVCPDFEQQFRDNKSCRLIMTKINPWHVLADKQHSKAAPILVLGDAAHAMVPFYGQGMNSGMEDALELFETLERTGFDDIGAAVEAYSKQRAPRGRAIQELSLRNYLEMRSHTASKLFLLRKKVEGYLNKWFPTKWVPLYKMVAFTRTPYDEAIEREAKQEALLTVVTSALVGLTAITLGAGIASVLPSQSMFSWQLVRK